MKAEKDQALNNALESKTIQGSVANDLRMHSLEMRYDEMQREFKDREYTIRSNREVLDRALLELQEARGETIRLKNKLAEQEYFVGRVKMLTTEVQELRAQRNMLQGKVTELAKSPFTKNIENLEETMRKLTEAEKKLEILKSQGVSIRERRAKANYENEHIKKQLQDAKLDLQSLQMEAESYQAGLTNDYLSRILSAYDPCDYRELMIKLGFEGGIPPWAKTSIMQPREPLTGKDLQILLGEIEKLKIQKAQLTGEIEKIQEYLKETGKIEENKSKIETRLEVVERKIEQTPFKDREPLRKELAKTKNVLGQPNALAGAANDLDNASEFSEDSQPEKLSPNANILEVLIIESELEQKTIEAIPGLPIINDLNTMLEVAFYNHDLKYSGEKVGQKPRYGLQIEFEIDQDDAFFGYLWQNSIEILCYAKLESGPKVIGKASMKLRKFFDFCLTSGNSAFSDRVPIICTIENPNITGEWKLGMIRYKLKMKNSIEILAKKFKTSMEAANITSMSEAKSEIVIPQKSYSVQISKCEGLKQKDPAKAISPFVFYEFYGKQHKTKTGVGSDPVYDDTEKFTFDSNKLFTDYLNEKSLEFVIFDDKGAQPDNNKDTKTDAVIGKAVVKLEKLIKNEEIKDMLPVYSEDGKEIVGYVAVLISPQAK